MEKTYYKAIVLVLASESELYNEFKAIYKQYKDSHPNIKVYFVYAGTTKLVPEDCDLVYSDLEETVIQPYPAQKVVKALQHINKLHDYDYLIRTNLSTFWIFDRLLERLNTLPKTGVLTGRLGYIPPDYVVGSDMVISKDLIDKLLLNEQKVYIPYNKKYIPEDRILSEFFTGFCGADIISAKNAVRNIEHLSWYDQEEVSFIVSKSAQVDHYRIKNFRNRDVDIDIHKYLLEYYYGKVY